MVNETFFEICFSRVGGEPVSILTLESPTETVAIFSDTCKKYVEDNLKSEADANVSICENSDVTPESIRKNHTLFTHNTWYLVVGQTQDDDNACFTVYHKHKALNPGWVWNSESTKVTHVGKFNVRKVTLGPKLLAKIADIETRENYAVNRISEANLKCLQNAQRTLDLNRREGDLLLRESDLDKRLGELKLYSQQLERSKNDLELWEKDIINWENYLESKELEYARLVDERENEINYLKTKILAYEIIDQKVSDYEVQLREKNRQIKNLQAKIEMLEEKHYSVAQEIEHYAPIVVKQEKPQQSQIAGVQQPHIYLDELKEFFANKHCRKHDDDDEDDEGHLYLEKIEKNVYRTDVTSFGKVKNE